MERHHSLGGAPLGDHQFRRREELDAELSREICGSAINFLGNPWFRPRCAFKRIHTFEDMDHRQHFLERHAVVISNVGPISVKSREEIKVLIQHHCGIHKHEFSIHRHRPKPYIAIFHETHARDVVFAAGRIVEGPFELEFHAWDLDRSGHREIVPYHVKISIEGLPQHAWCPKVAQKVMCDEVTIQYVDEATRKRTYRSVFSCWALSKDPSKIPQMVLLSMNEYEPGLRHADRIHHVRPRQMKNAHVFKVLIHIDAIEDLLFYHHPRDELIQEGKTPWRDFRWEL
jgi:hypothetical protein